MDTDNRGTVKVPQYEADDEQKAEKSAADIRHFFSRRDDLQKGQSLQYSA